MEQDFFRCETCNFNEENNLGVCSTCVKVCHSGHNVTYAGKMNAFCDCGAKEDRSCFALDMKSKTSYVGMYL